jgi:hypothetical protein
MIAATRFFSAVHIDYSPLSARMGIDWSSACEAAVTRTLQEETAVNFCFCGVLVIHVFRFRALFIWFMFTFDCRLLDSASLLHSAPACWCDI